MPNLRCAPDTMKYTMKKGTKIGGIMVEFCYFCGMKKITFLPEWTKCDCVLVAIPGSHTDWADILPEALEQYNRLLKAFTNADYHVVALCNDTTECAPAFEGVRSDRLLILDVPYNDTWTRDYGPLTVVREQRLRALDFGFNGWGLKFASDRDNLVNLHLSEKFIIMPEVYRNERSFELEGGSVDTDGCGTILTTTRCLTSPNRNGGQSKEELNRILHDRLGAEHVLWIDYGALAGDDTDSHVDTLARMAPGNSILFTGCRNVDDDHFEELLKMRAQLSMFRTPTGDPYNLIELPLPDPVFDPDGERLPATYANYLVMNRHIFMPTYGQPHNDMLACQTVKIAFPDHEVVGVDCRVLLRQHGSLHCATMQIPEGAFNQTVFESV